MEKPAIVTAEPGFRPLYQQVRELLLARLIDGTWPPGTLLPSEYRLAEEMHVSQGTVRKALDSLASEQLLVRRQGRGTFVAEQEEGRILFKFFKLASDDGIARFPVSTVLGLRKLRAEAGVREKLGLGSRSSIWEINRTRSIGGRTAMTERILLPTARFPGLDSLVEIPNNLFALYSSRFGITIGHVATKLKAVAAEPEDARHLGVPLGTPLLFIDRLAFSLDGAPVEWRLSRCLSDEFHYAAGSK